MKIKKKYRYFLSIVSVIIMLSTLIFILAGCRSPKINFYKNDKFALSQYDNFYINTPITIPYFDFEKTRIEEEKRMSASENKKFRSCSYVVVAYNEMNIKLAQTGLIKNKKINSKTLIVDLCFIEGKSFFPGVPNLDGDLLWFESMRYMTWQVRNINGDILYHWSYIYPYFATSSITSKEGSLEFFRDSLKHLQ